MAKDRAAMVFRSMQDDSLRLAARQGVDSPGGHRRLLRSSGADMIATPYVVTCGETQLDGSTKMGLC